VPALPIFNESSVVRSIVAPPAIETLEPRRDVRDPTYLSVSFDQPAGNDPILVLTLARKAEQGIDGAHGTNQRRRRPGGCRRRVKPSSRT
jgi:hypothetical protein